MKEKIYIPIKIDNNEILITDEIIKQIDNENNKKIIIELLNDDFTNIKIEKQKEILGKIENLVNNYKIYGLKITSNPDSIDKINLKFLKKHNVKEIELLIESSNNYILKHIGAEYKFDYAKKIAKKIKFLGFKLNVMLTLGLPESTVADDFNTVKQIISLKPIQICLNLCQPNYNKTIKNLYERNEYQPLSKIQLIERIKESIYLINNSKIKNIVIGKENQLIENMTIQEFRNLLKSEIWYDRIVEMIKSYNVKVKEVEIEVNSKDVQNVGGLKGENLKQLKDVYDVELKILNNDKINEGNYKMKILKTYTDFLDDDNN